MGKAIIGISDLVGEGHFITNERAEGGMVSNPYRVRPCALSEIRCSRNLASQRADGYPFSEREELPEGRGPPLHRLPERRHEAGSLDVGREEPLLDDGRGRSQYTKQELQDILTEFRKRYI